MSDIQTSNERQWQEKVVIAFGFVKAILVLSFNMLMVKLAYEGFKAGEMGIMVGILVSVMVLFILPVTVLLIVMFLKIIQRKRWALIVSIIFTVVLFFINIVYLGVSFGVFFPIVITIVFLLVLEIRLLPYFS